MTYDEVQAKVVEVTADRLQVEADTIKPESLFVKDLGADSLDLVELIMALEDDETGFGFEIPDGAAQDLKTVKDAVDYIANRLKVG